MACLCQLVILSVLAIIPPTLPATTNVDLTGPGCDSLDGYYLKTADDMITLYAYPQYNTMATRDHCDVTVRADQYRRIQYIIETIYFNECGVEIIIYDSPTIDANQIYSITCSYNSRVPIQGKTRYNVLRLRVRKTTPESRAFSFSMRMKNDLGPPFSFEQDAASYTGQTLEPSAIAGIAVAGGIIVIAVVLLAIFLCYRARSSNLKDQSYATDSKSIEYVSGRTESTLEPQKKQLSQGAYSSQKQSMNQWQSEPRPPRRMRPPVPEPTQPAPRDPDRKGLSDRHRSGERTTRSVSQPSHMGRRGRDSMA
ncbi:hypothetical protein BsWGS_11220 [Bradybaena similaris]